MRRYRISARLAVASAMALFVITLLVPSASAAFRYLQEGMTAPVIEGKDLRTGAKVTSDLGGDGRIVIIVFWATWSNRSLEELVDLKAISEQYAHLPVSVIAVNVEQQEIFPETRKLIDAKVSELELPFPVVVDAELRRFYEFGVIAVPSTAVLDTTGVLRYGPAGYSLTTRDRIVDTFEVLLGLKEPTKETELVVGYTPVRKATRYYGLALQLAHERMYERALANLITAQEADSLFSAPHNLRGNILMELDSLSAAIDEFALAVQKDSSSVAAWAGWGRALLRSEQYDDARVKLAAALYRDSSYTPALLDLALCFSAVNDPEQAIDSLVAARELNQRDPMVHYYLGRVFKAADRRGEALTSFLTALEILFPSP